MPLSFKFSGARPRLITSEWGTLLLGAADNTSNKIFIKSKPPILGLVILSFKLTH